MGTPVEHHPPPTLADEEAAITRALLILQGRLRQRNVLGTTNAVNTYLRLQSQGLPHEVFAVMYLDTHHRLIAYERLFRGTLAATTVHPREIAKQALLLDAASVILHHNHPSGICLPSPGDHEVTQALKAALALLEVRVLDHVITSDTEAFSMAECVSGLPTIPSCGRRIFPTHQRQGANDGEEFREIAAPIEVCAVQGPRALDCAAATVPVFERDTEEPVLGQLQWEAVHERHSRGLSISAISRELEIDRKTVRTCLRQASWQPYSREAAASLLDPHREWLIERAPEVGYSARILWQELRAQRGFTGSYVIVRRAVAPLRLEASVASLTQRRFETGPGEQAQCDWGQVTVRLSGVRTEIHVFVMTLGYSRRGFAMGFLRERMPDLLAAHEAAFAHFGGRCEFLLYDRMRTVVLGQSAGGPRLNTTFANFASHWGFTPRLCQPYRAQTKGKVESGVKYVKRNFVPGRQFRDLEDFNAQLAAWQLEVADLRIHGTTHQQPIVRFAEEARALAPTAGHPSFLAAMVRDRIVADDWLVSIDANRYSVPFALIGKTVQVVRQGGSWVIRHRGEVVAEHPVLAGRAQLSVQPAHGPGAAPRNVRQRHGSRPPQGRVQADLSRDVEVRDLAIYEHLFDAPALEVAA